MKCKDCGLLEKKDQIYTCVRFEKKVAVEETTSERDCQYFTEVIYEEGEPLSPRQHLIIQNGAQRSRRLQGPI